MTDKAIKPIVEATKKALPSFPKWPLRFTPERVKPPACDIGEKNWKKQLSEILKGQ